MSLYSHFTVVFKQSVNKMEKGMEIKNIRIFNSKGLKEG